jgi:hypothetical protein
MAAKSFSEFLQWILENWVLINFGLSVARLSLLEMPRSGANPIKLFTAVIY